MARRTSFSSGRQAALTTPRHPPPALRLVLLYGELAVAGSDGLTQQEMLARPALQVLYTPGRTSSAASQALRRDLILLTGNSTRSRPRLFTRAALSEPHEVQPLLRYDPVTRRYACAVPTEPLRLTAEALEALCMLASALHSGRTLPGGAELFNQLRAALPPDQQTSLLLALEGLLSDQARPTLHLDLPDLEEESLDTLRRLTHAIRRRQTIDFDYLRRQSSAPTSHRGDEALEIWIGTHMYVSVWCEVAQSELDLRLDRIVPGSLHMHPRSATRRQRRGERIRYWLAPEIAQGGVSVRLEKQEVHHQTDGSAIVSGIARSRFWARRLLLSYGSNARALWPSTLVEDLRRTSEEMAQRYQDIQQQWELDPLESRGEQQ